MGTRARRNDPVTITYGPSMTAAEILATADDAATAILAARGLGKPLNTAPDAPGVVPAAVVVSTGPKVPKWLQKINEAPSVPTPGAEPHAFIGPDSRVCLGVWLDGARGGGKRITVNEADWRRVSLAWGDRWTVQESKPGYSYVVGMGRASGLILARMLCGASAGETVMFRDGDPTNLSKGNLQVVPAGVAVMRALGRERVGERVAVLRDFRSLQGAA